MTKPFPEKFKNCFVCSPTNPKGLHLVNEPVDGKAHMEFTPDKYMAGLTGIMHGGFSLMIMDEVMLYAVDTALGVDSVTLNTHCDFLNPAKVEHRYIAEAWVEHTEGKKIFVEGVLMDADDDNKEIVKTKGLYYQVDMDSFLPEEK